MAKATAKHITPAAPANPVVELSKSLLTLWNADDGFQAESKHGSASQIRGDTISQISEWRNAVETMISVTQARNVEGGWYNSSWLLMQWTTYRHRSTRKNRISAAMKLDRLIRSAMDAIGGDSERCRSHRSSDHGMYGAGNGKWIDCVGKGATLRSQKS